MPLIIRPSYDDEIARAKSLLGGHAIPNHAQFYVAINDTPVERIVAAIPYWQSPRPGDDECSQMNFHLGLPMEKCSAPFLEDLLPHLIAKAKESDLCSLRLDISLPDQHPLFDLLSEQGFTIAQTDRTFSVPGDIVKNRSIRIYQRLEKKIPSSWSISSIRGQDPEKLFKFAAQHGLISPQVFQNYWNTGSREHFEEAYSKVLLNGETIIGLFLVTQRGDHELHVHVEASCPDYSAQSGLIAATLRNASFSACAEDFPKIFTWRADSDKHLQTANTAIRQGGTELAQRHFLTKKI